MGEQDIAIVKTLQFFEEWLDTFEEFYAHPAEFIDAGDHAVAHEALTQRS